MFFFYEQVFFIMLIAAISLFADSKTWNWTDWNHCIDTKVPLFVDGKLHVGIEHVADGGLSLEKTEIDSSPLKLGLRHGRVLDSRRVLKRVPDSSLKVVPEVEVGELLRFAQHSPVKIQRFRPCHSLSLVEVNQAI